MEHFLWGENTCLDIRPNLEMAVIRTKVLSTVPVHEPPPIPLPFQALLLTASDGTLSM